MTEESLCDAPPFLSVIMPTYNEAATIEELVQRALDAAPAEKQVIVVDDGSADGMWELVRE